MLPYQMQDTYNITWFLATSPLECATLTFSNVCCRPKGLLYNQEAGLCGAILWDEEASPEIPVLGSGSTNLYQFTNSACKPGYQAYPYFDGNSVTTTCLSWSLKKKHYLISAGMCREQGAVLASTKTIQKLELLKSIAPNLFWVGLDALQNVTTFVWRDDGTVLSPERAQDLFIEGKPAYAEDKECASYKEPDTRLRDGRCVVSKNFFCELKPGC
ncbi:C-type lectin-related protein 2 [Elysia marginata]|uniref:C-type lectin-related protein 2 n=1 Tax=Elysia marginata TaxID=1093978 RepID=A0AAV4JM53_9GAST|nr:C-type lectin-related protein 2 [Elysia marginata]